MTGIKSNSMAEQMLSGCSVDEILGSVFPMQNVKVFIPSMRIRTLLTSTMTLKIHKLHGQKSFSILYFHLVYDL